MHCDWRSIVARQFSNRLHHLARTCHTDNWTRQIGSYKRVLLSTRGRTLTSMSDNQDERENNVVLTWEVSSANESSSSSSCSQQQHMHIHLQPASRVRDSSSSSNKSNITVKPSEEEDAVLQFERQVRKAQHAKKAGAILKPEDLVVVHHDEHIVVVNKPPGVLTVPGLKSRSSILNLVHERFGPSIEDEKQKDHEESPVPTTITTSDQMVVHRLDMDTSGLLIFGRTLPVTRQLQKQFRDRQVRKEYECLVMGHVPKTQNADDDDDSPSLLIDLPLQRDHQHPPFRRVSTPASEAAAHQLLEQLHSRGMRKHWKIKRPQKSQSRARILQRQEKDGLECTRLRLEPLTGRTHQLRVHCAALGFPIVGDPTYALYGEAAPVGGLENVPALVLPEQMKLNGCSLDLQKAWTHAHPPNDKPMCLHAALLELDHPITGERMKWEVPPDF